jgi:3'-5' exoribonuclease
MAHTFMNQIQAGQPIDGVFLVKDPILRSTAKGDYYIAMYVCDRTGQANGRMWQATEAVYLSIPKPGFVHIRGRSEMYQNNMQIVINSVRVVPTEEVDLEDFLPRTKQDVAQMYKEVLEMLDQIKSPALKALVAEFTGDEARMAQFCKSPAAVKMHHDYLGGLLEHTHNMLRVAVSIFPLYPHIQKDLVLAAIFLHDMGKTEELACDMAFSYTDSGQLVGHIVKCTIWIQQKADALRAKGQTISQEAVDALCHIVLAHHGSHEFGSPKLPAMSEAFMVNYIDNLDAKMNQVNNLVERELSDANWTAWQNSLQTRLYRKRVE